MKENYACWVEFAHEAGHGDVNPILVTGVDRTKDFSMMCYANYDDSFECEFKTSAPDPALVWGTWKTSKFVYTNHGPQLCSPPSSQTADLTPSDTGNAADEYNQCVFVRYFTMRSRRLWVPKLKAAAGPHDLGSGDRNSQGSLQGPRYDSDESGSEIASSLLESGGEDSGSATSADSGSDIVVHVPSDVRHLSLSLVVLIP